ncbi:MAG: glycosyltransferase family 4 protein [Bacteroidia bacterium]|nr:glycosyltransferase family 4 protein [Bacteroidia bacterium]
MRIALITDGISPYVLGGMQRHSYNLAKTLAGMGVEIDLYHTDKGSGDDIHCLTGMTEGEKSRITSIFVPWPSGDRLPGHYLRDLSRYSHSAMAIYQSRTPVDLVYAKGLTGGAFLKARKKGVKMPPIAVKAHGYEMFQPPPSRRVALEHALLRPFFRRQALDADVVFSYGGKITSLLQERIGVPRARIREIPSGISAEWLQPQPGMANTPRRFVFLGRYERRKGIEEIYHCIEAHPEWQEKATFTFIGPIAEDKQLALPHVSYSGIMQNPESLRAALSSADVLLCPSFSEGMPNVILEGMSRGLAVIATDVGAVSFLVENGVNGWLLSPGDSKSLGQAIIDAIGSTDEALISMKSHSIRIVKESFTWDKIGLKTKEVMEKIIAG